MLDSDILVMLTIFASILVGFVFTIAFLYKHSDCFGMKISSRYMKTDKKLLAFFTSAPVIIWMTMGFILTLLNIKFTF